MHYIVTLLQIAAVYSLALISPGPNFLMITQLSLSGRRALGVVAALGVGAGSTLWATLAMLGFATVLQRVDWIYNGVRIGGALYLAWLGLKLLRSGARQQAAPLTSVAPIADTVPPAAIEAPPPPGRDTWLRAWRTGFLTCLTSPKACVFWTSVFAAMLPAHPPRCFYGV